MHTGGSIPLPGLVWRCLGGASRDRTGDLLLAKQALSQLSYGPARGACRTHPPMQVVGLGRFELPASPLSGVRSDQLSYRPEVGCVSPMPDLEPGQTFRLDFQPEDQVTCVGSSRRDCGRVSLKGGDPAARSRTATLLRLHPSH
jgi:hypothetical protein